MDQSLKTVLIIVGVILFLFAHLYLIYRCIFTVSRKKAENQVSLYKGAAYRERKDEIFDLILRAKALPSRGVTTTSFDGYELYGSLYETDPDAPFLLIFHGYKSGGLRDVPYWILDGTAKGYNLLAVDQRTHRKSGGRCVSLGVRERFDVQTWAEYIAKNYGEDKKITVMGASMGAGTVLMAAALPFPDSVSGIVADGGYTSASDIMKKVSLDRHVPLWFSCPLMWISAKIFGNFRLGDGSALEALPKTKIPVLIIHGEKDAFVPCSMAKENYEACNSEKELYIIPGAGHGLCYLTDPDRYRKVLGGFLERTNPVVPAETVSAERGRV